MEVGNWSGGVPRYVAEAQKATWVERLCLS